MYDGSIYRVFTGVIVRVVPNAAHFEMHFVPLNEERTALVRDEKGEPLVWVVQMESAAQRVQARHHARELPAGHRRSAWAFIRGGTGSRPATAGMSGLFQCPKGKAPEPGKHCDSVEGSKAFGEGELPPEGPVAR